MRGKREFVQHVLNYMEDGGFITGWDRTRSKARNDYYVQLKGGGIAVIDLIKRVFGRREHKQV
jgi:ribosomal protein S8